MIKKILICLLFLFVFFGCEDTNLQLATKAGIDVIKAATLNDREVKLIAATASKQSDSNNQIAGIRNSYGMRLEKLVGDRYNSDGCLISRFIVTPN